MEWQDWHYFKVAYHIEESLSLIKRVANCEPKHTDMQAKKLPEHTVSVKEYASHLIFKYRETIARIDKKLEEQKGLLSAEEVRLLHTRASDFQEFIYDLRLFL